VPPVYLGAELALGLVGSKDDPKAAANRAAYANPTNQSAALLGYLGTNGTPSLVSTVGTGSDQYPLVRTLSDGTQLNQSQWYQLASLVNDMSNPYTKNKTTQADVDKFLAGLPKTNVKQSSSTPTTSLPGIPDYAQQALQQYYAGLVPYKMGP